MCLECVCPDAVILTPPQITQNSAHVQDLLVCACAVGVATCFAAPVGGKSHPLLPSMHCFVLCICTLYVSLKHVCPSHLLYSVFLLSWYIITLWFATSTQLCGQVILLFFLCFSLSIIISPSIWLYSFFLFLFHVYSSLPPTQCTR